MNQRIGVWQKPVTMYSTNRDLTLEQVEEAAWRAVARLPEGFTVTPQSRLQYELWLEVDEQGEPIYPTNFTVEDVEELLDYELEEDLMKQLYAW